MINIKVMLISFAITSAIIWPLYIFFRSKIEKNKISKPCLTFNQFIKFYNVSPERFYLHLERIVVYFPCDEAASGFSTETYYFKTKKDTKKYEKWREFQEKKTGK